MTQTPEALHNLSPDDLDRLTVLSKVSSMLNKSINVDEVLECIMEIVLNITGAERAFVLLRQDNVGKRVFKAVGVKEDMYSHSIVQLVLARGEALVSVDVASDQTLSGSLSLQALGTRSVMCVPMRASENDLGLIYLDNSMRAGVFNEKDKDLLQVIADMSAAALDRARIVTLLLQNEKMATLGTAIGGIAHELNSPLTALMWVGERLKEEIPDSHIVPLFEREMNRCHDLSRNLLRIVRKEQTPRRPIRLPAVVGEAVQLVHSDFQKANIELVISSSPDVPPVMACAEQIAQVLVILLNNSRQALADCQKPCRVVIETTCQGESVLLRVQDNGPGIPAEHLDRIFDPFFTTKPIGEGTGLGLSICRGLIREHGGDMRAENGSDGGAAFFIGLPALDASTPVKEEQAEHTTVVPRPTSNVPETVRILYAEDEDSIRDLLVRYFRRKGYSIDPVPNGKEAVDLFTQDPDYDLVILDMVMPVMSGVEAYFAIRKIRSEVAVLVSSGSTAGDYRQFFGNAPNNFFMPKPYRPAEILEMVQKISAGC